MNKGGNRSQEALSAHGKECRKTGPGVPWLGGPLGKERALLKVTGHHGDSVTGSGNPSHANANKPRLAAASGQSLGLRDRSTNPGREKVMFLLVL